MMTSVSAVCLLVRIDISNDVNAQTMGSILTIGSSHPRSAEWTVLVTKQSNLRLSRPQAFVFQHWKRNNECTFEEYIT